MFSLLFRNRWFALGWAVLTLASALLFVGKDGGVEVIAKGTRQIQAQRVMLASEPVPASIPVAASAAAEPAPPDLPPLQAIPGSAADPATPQVGDVFIDPITGQRVRAVRRSDYTAPQAEMRAYSSSAALP